MNMVFCRGRDKGFISDRTIWRPFQSAVAGQGGDTRKVGQAGDGTAVKPAHQVSQADKSHDESQQGLQGNTEDQSACERELADDTVKLQTQVVSSETSYLNLF